MKVYFTAAIARSDDVFRRYSDIIDYLKSLHHTVISNIEAPTKDTIDEIPRKNLLDLQAKVEHWIHDCDFMVVDTLTPSVSVGYEISHAMRLRKPVLVFHDTSGPPSLLRFHKNVNLISEQYDPKTFKDAIDQFVRTIEWKSETKFIFLITPDIAAFLDDVVAREKTPKSVYVRKLIEKDMKSQGYHLDI
ncbi:MAG TPA: hypothetical protein VNX65_04205 [Patescibacteria group bacterium]|jgi:hypothetical protein|nr:hypothetical protein [Patescibacteria group bacterium]